MYTHHSFEMQTSLTTDTYIKIFQVTHNFLFKLKVDAHKYLYHIFLPKNFVPFVDIK